MNPSVGNFDFNKRAQEKRQTRIADERALASAPRPVKFLKAENEVFAPLAAASRIDLPASRSLS